MPLRRRASSASPSSLLLLLLLVALLAGSAAAAGPIRYLGPEGYISSVGELRFPSPQDSGHMLATQAHDLWESRDGGASWRSLLSPPNQELGRLAIDPFDRAHWLIGGIGAGAPLLYETRDGGRTWSSRTWPVVAIRPFIVFDDRVAGRIVVDEPGVQLILSGDGGVTWEAISPPSSPFPVFSPFLLGVRQSQFYFSWRQELWAYNPDSGTWSQVSNGSVGTLSEMWPDATNPNILFARYSDNLFRSNDGGRSFVQILDTGGGDFDFRQSRTNPSHLAVLAKTSLHLSLDRGSTWSPELLVPSFDPSGLAFDPVNGELVFHENEALVRRHADGSRTPFRPRGLFAVTLADFHVDPLHGPTYAVNFGGAFYRRGAAGRWIFVGQTGCDDPKRISVTPWSPERIYLTCGSQELLFSDDGGVSWTSDYFPGLSGGLPNRIVLTPGDPGRAFILAPQYFIRPIEPASEFFPYIADVVVHPDAAAA
jgi:photosystem II stability/assembly factor-like uncharacterized protein